MAKNIDARRLRVDDLRYLLALARTGRLVAAASALGVDHTTVSRRITALEKRIGRHRSFGCGKRSSD
ncbi:helix-turn-helix domain-containing protein [Saccharopolyspora sp. NPDC000995]